MTYPRPRPPQFSVKVRRGSSGLGLFALEDIPKGRFIIEYWGEVVKDEVADEVGGKYLFDLDNGKSILGGDRQNIARYANHACRPNSEPRQVGDRIFIFSKRRIKAGEEITYHYGKEYFEGLIEPKGCRCRTCVKRREKERSAKG